jgi:hypothetical protein
MLRAKKKGARNFLVLFLAQYLARFQIEQMHAGADDAFERLISVVIVGHLIGGPPQRRPGQNPG